jgi:hypothetical protein
MITIMSVVLSISFFPFARELCCNIDCDRISECVKSVSAERPFKQTCHGIDISDSLRDKGGRGCVGEPVEFYLAFVGTEQGFVAVGFTTGVSSPFKDDPACCS